MDLEKIKAIVFDLDGTLYEDTHHFSYYADCLKKRFHKEKQEVFQQEYGQALQGQHAIKMGRVFDLENDLILVMIEGKVKEAYKWDGTPLTEIEMEKLYTDPIIIDMDRFLSIGDMWWVSSTIARRFGLKMKEIYEAFLETREYMISSEFIMKPVEGLKEALEEVSGRVSLALLTNSPQPDSEIILEKLGLDKVFHYKVFNGEKPGRTLEQFHKIAEIFEVEYDEILSVGDNWVNDIRPAREIGCSTIFVDCYYLGNEDSADIVVNKVSELVPYIKRLK